ncbi:MAG: endonuclease/exonuclease/phosphatase family protein [Bifidobacteriaceae bacterium]|jgi:endonuclease/exonuclease/phosphatase family metal-dependent hydrolase|nr:endonuclease/exonuclease/phosphatase family protein [Bifidobacteriaceae bacterium]
METIPSTMTVRVLTLNVWNTDGPPQRRQALPGAIAALNPDLISFQEVVKTTDYDQLADLLSETDLIGFHDSDVLEAPSIGTALASRWPPAAVVGSLLPGPPEFPPCNLLAAAVALPIGVELTFIAVKPYPPLNGEQHRLRQAVYLAQIAEALARPAPTVVAGDFDATPDADCMRFFAGRRVADGVSTHYLNAWDVAGDGGPGHTWTAVNPWVGEYVDSGLVEPGHARRIDHILVHGPEGHAIRWGAAAAKDTPRVKALVLDCRVVLDDPPLSDHYGVLAEIEFTVVEP